ncbi:Rhs family protein [Hahella chejuensis KCTC 2396]|uniref:Rhs family protein n=1 Tax=Hahella chejuensis (strain KCTC 2396) TaxID=349521 RepID=Q2SKA1_HAHCH|nr:Rhs family protein [Hahella chejuensis KCTC 2396]
MEETQPTGAVLSYSYDKAGNKTSATVTHQGKTETTTYLYDALNRLSKVIDPQGGETLYAYDAVGNRESVTQANGQTTAYIYDALNRLTRQTTADAANNVIADYRYTLHSTGRREQIEELHNGRVSTYTYDALYRLTHDTISDPVNGDYSAEYRFDKVGNRTYSIIDGVHIAYSYDDNDRLTQQGGVTYAYDANGNTLTETEDGLVTARYTYSAKNKLLAVTKAGETTSFGYNPDGIRTRKAGSGSTTDFIVDQNRDYAQVLQEDVNGAKQVSYVYGDDLLSQARAGDVSYYVYDGQGSVRSLTNQTGVQTDNYHYDAFGILLHSEGDTPNSYLYTGEQYDASLDQYYLRARYYDQNQGRFTQMDAWEGESYRPTTLNKYIYADNDPISKLDPTGRYSVSLSGMGTAFNVSGVINTIGISAILAYEYDSNSTIDNSIFSDLEVISAHASVKSKADAKANQLSLEVQKAISATSESEGWHAHHTVPVYTCGAVEQSPNMVPLKSSFHRALHGSLRLYAEFLDKSYGAEFESNRSIFDHTSKKNRSGLQKVASTSVGRAYIANHLDIFYSFGWYAGNKYFKQRFESERNLFISTSYRNSLPSCQR